MSDKSPKKNTAKKPAGKTLKEKRTAKHDKKAASSRAAETDSVTRIKSR